jgi:hypothetical protein
MSDFSLVTLLRSDPDFAPRLAKKREEVKKDKQNLLKMATDYSEKYHEQIEEGTRRSVKMIGEGKDRGKSEEEVMKEVYRGGFVPMISTPLLNLLYFILHESEEIDRELYKSRDKYNQEYGNVEDRDSETLSDNFRTPDDMFTYLYGHITLDTFNKLKKLKSLTKSPNIEESTLAFKKCRELCNKYNIEYDRIPCYVS